MSEPFVVSDDERDTILNIAEAATPVLALLAAILRARQAADTEGQS